MEGLARAAGSPVPVRFRGEMILIPPFTYKDIGTVENYILSKRRNPLDVMREMLADKTLSEAMQEKVVAEAYKDAKAAATVTAEEYGRFAGSRAGVTFILWMLINKQYPGRFTLDQVETILDEMQPEDAAALKRATEMASGTDELGNSTGRTSPTSSEGSPAIQANLPPGDRSSTTP